MKDYKSAWEPKPKAFWGWIPLAAFALYGFGLILARMP